MNVESQSFATYFLEIALASLFILIALRVLRELSRPSIEVSSGSTATPQAQEVKRREYSKSMA
ncbi:MAG: hypothetical protein P1V97_38470 [Planctomycetota bacterium]|nr:hypothetical protein [Planctomycetota bacterium]